MAKWKMVRLGDIGSIVTGNTPQTSDSQNYSSMDIPFYKPGDLQESKITALVSSENFISEYARSRVRILPEGSILVTCIGIIGKVGIANEEAACNQQINAVIPNEQLCNNRYLAYALLEANMRLNDIANGAVVSIVNKTQFSNFRIPLPPLPVQRQIADVLDRASALIQKRKAQIDKLDLLAKAQFIEMFGDPVTNPRGWGIARLSELAEIKIGPFGSLLHKEDYIENGHALVNPSHIVDGKIETDTRLTISDKKYRQLSAYSLKPGDVVLGRRGEMGRCAVVQSEGLLCGTGSLVIRLKDKMSPYLLQKIISFPTYKKIIENSAVGVTMLNLNVPIVSGFHIPLLPLKCQREYTTFVQQVEVQRALLHQSLVKLELNYKSLMQKCFGGRMFNG